MLSRLDDYPVHQAPEPLLSPATSDRNVYDRYWMNGFDRDGEFYFAFGLARYQHRGIQDAAFSVVIDGRQYALHASGRAPAEPTDTAVGSMRLEITEPMQSMRLLVSPNEAGIEGELVYSARTANIEEARQTMRRDGRVIMDATRFTQWGRWSGSLRVDGRELEIDPARVLGTKDRSWGVRPVGEPDAGGAPSAELPQIFFLWAPLHWDDHCTHLGLFEDAQGGRWHQGGAVLPAYDSLGELPGVEDPATRRARAVDYEVDYIPGTRRAAAARLLLDMGDGERREITLEPLLTFRMKGLGYLHPEWGQGVWKGEQAEAGESWAVDDIDELALENIHVQQVVRARCGSSSGVGVLEQLAIGLHAPSGFTDFFGGAE
ncbi:MAG TPA: hypothetical protein EYG16_02720 [Deltaproteobacteria bacterium]|nr:hypothetical protein [Candidatus Binatota bacterium]HIL12567.1 hypothetical protein [Deltaproteobacteria bacterium]